MAMSTISLRVIHRLNLFEHAPVLNRRKVWSDDAYQCQVANDLPYFLDPPGPFITGRDLSRLDSLHGPIMTGRAQCLYVEKGPLGFLFGLPSLPIVSPNTFTLALSNRAHEWYHYCWYYILKLKQTVIATIWWIILVCIGLLIV